MHSLKHLERLREVVLLSQLVLPSAGFGASAGFVSAGFASAPFGLQVLLQQVLVQQVLLQVVMIILIISSSNSAILVSRSFFVPTLRFAAIP